MSEEKNFSPAKPVGMEIVFYYHCPYCSRRVPLIAPVEPSMGQCDACGNQFPVVPADEKNIRYIKTILDNGKAAIDPNFV
ncbi:MAG: hypothetical protein ACOCZ2_01635 [Thermodesulfobacteriota bacterium]